MASPQLQQAPTPESPYRANEAVRPTSDKEPPAEYPVREYIAGMSRELAQMARWDGDEGLAVLLEAAVARAESPGS